jgi:hypothetical protein
MRGGGDSSLYITSEDLQVRISALAQDGMETQTSMKAVVSRLHWVGENRWHGQCRGGIGPRVDLQDPGFYHLATQERTGSCTYLSLL